MMGDKEDAHKDDHLEQHRLNTAQSGAAQNKHCSTEEILEASTEEDIWIEALEDALLDLEGSSAEAAPRVSSEVESNDLERGSAEADSRIKSKVIQTNLLKADISNRDYGASYGRTHERTHYGEIGRKNTANSEGGLTDTTDIGVLEDICEHKLTTGVLEDKCKTELEKLENEWFAGYTLREWGDSFVCDKQKDSMRLLSQNTRGALGNSIKLTNTRTPEEQCWKMKALGVDVWGLADTKLQDPKSKTQRTLYTAGKYEATQSREWGGQQMRIVTSEGYRGKHGWNGGVAISTHEELKVYAGSKHEDPRGWGRFVITELRGANGNTVAIAQGYMPSRSTTPGGWQRQLQLMDNLKKQLELKQEPTHEEKLTLEHLTEDHQAAGYRSKATPRSMLLHDLRTLLLKIGATYNIIGMDWNSCPPGRGSARSGKDEIELRRDRAEVEMFAQELALVEPMQELHDETREAAGGSRIEPRTWKGTGENAGLWSWIDYWLVTKKLVQRGLVRRIGVLEDKLDGTDHAACLMDLDRDNLLGKSQLWQDIKKEVQRKKADKKQAAFKAVKLNSDTRVDAYKQALYEVLQTSMGSSHKNCDTILRLQEEAARGKLSEDKWEQAEIYMRQLEEALVLAQEKVWDTLPKTGGVRKNWYSKEYVEIARKARRLQKYALAWRRGMRGDRLAQQTELIAGQDSGTIA